MKISSSTWRRPSSSEGFASRVFARRPISCLEPIPEPNSGAWRSVPSRAQTRRNWGLAALVPRRPMQEPCFWDRLLISATSLVLSRVASACCPSIPSRREMSSIVLQCPVAQEGGQVESRPKDRRKNNFGICKRPQPDFEISSLPWNRISATNRVAACAGIAPKEREKIAQGDAPTRRGSPSLCPGLTYLSLSGKPVDNATEAFPPARKDNR
jgi:hypothetical protein